MKWLHFLTYFIREYRFLFLVNATLILISSLISAASVLTLAPVIDILASSESNMGFEGIMLGLPYIYLDTGKGVQGDPFSKVDSLRWQVRNDKELNRVLMDIIALPNDKLNKLRKKARHEVCKYLEVTNEQSLKVFRKILKC